MEFIWRPMYDSLGSETEIFTHAMYHHYNSPTGFDFENQNKKNRFISDQSDKDYNAPEKTKQFEDWINGMKDSYKSDHLLVPMGDDFRFKYEPKYFETSDRFIAFFNENNASNITLMYSTPSQYIDAINAQNLTWPLKYDDMQPYAREKGAYWTGFFTSRPNSKDQIRRASQIMQSSSQMFALNMLNNEQNIQTMLDATGAIMDAVGVT